MARPYASHKGELSYVQQKQNVSREIAKEGVQVTN